MVMTCEMPPPRLKPGKPCFGVFPFLLLQSIANMNWCAFVRMGKDRPVVNHFFWNCMFFGEPGTFRVTGRVLFLTTSFVCCDALSG